MNTIKSAASALRAHWSMKSQNRGRCIEIATAGLTPVGTIPHLTNVNLNRSVELRHLQMR